MPATKHVSHVAAGDHLERAPAHPRLQGQLEVLGTPDVKTGIIFPQPLEIFLVNAEQPSRHRWGVGGGPGVNSPSILAIIVITWMRRFQVFTSRLGTWCQLNLRFQSKPPTGAYCWKLYWNVSSWMASMAGQTTVVGLANRR